MSFFGFASVTMIDPVSFCTRSAMRCIVADPAGMREHADQFAFVEGDANSPSVPLRPPTKTTKSELWMLCVSRPIKPEPVKTMVVYG